MTTKAQSLAEVSESIVTSRKVANNTFFYELESGERRYRLHQTDIVTVKPNGSFILDTGGWMTPTTKERMNRYIPNGYSVTSDRGIWYVQNGRGRHALVSGLEYPAAFKRDDSKVIKSIRDMKKRIKNFVALIDDMDELPTPEGGDCWLCMAHLPQLNDDPQLQWNHFERTVEPPGGAEHLLSHIEEGYIHGSLIVLALAYSGYGFQSIRHTLSYGYKDTAKRVLRRFLNAMLVQQ